jgi:hypothetical protein
MQRNLRRSLPLDSGPLDGEPSAPRQPCPLNRSTRKMRAPQRSEVWLIDFGLAGKTRPALVVNVAFSDRDRALITVVPDTTSLRFPTFEIVVRVPFLKPGASWCRASPRFPPSGPLPPWFAHTADLR